MKITIPILFISLFVFACGYQEGVIQKTDRSFLMFTGNWQNVSVQIDDLSPFVLSNTVAPEGKQTSSDEKLYQLSPGKHTLKVHRNGKLLIHRVLFLENHATREVQIP